jgi:ParB/RepB/Spo0J family partition protein
MAVEFRAEHTRTSEYLFLPQDIHVKPELNGRHDAPDIEWLIADIVEQGQIQPVIVRNDGGKAVLVAGFSRWSAISEINKRKLTTAPVKVRCVYSRCNELDGLKLNIAENKFRNNTTPMDDAYNIARLERHGMNIEGIAGVYRESEAWVKGRVALVSADASVQKAVAEKRVKPTAAARIAKLTQEQQRELASGNGKITSADIAKVEGKAILPNLRDVLSAIDSMNGPGVGKDVQAFIVATLDYAVGKTKKIVLKEVE